MMRYPFFIIYGLGLLGLATVAEYKGWSFSNYNEVRGVPKSIRDNPGAYRSIYRGYSRYLGGK
ncbi:MAG: hypothetical protein ACRD7E_06490 [Bryobacteraceae bacterium]